MIKNITDFTKSINKTDPNFIDVLLKRAEISTNDNAFTFLNNGFNEILNFNELDKKVKKIAAHLQTFDLKDQRALLLYPAGLDYIIGFIACLYAGVIAVPVYPPDPTNIKKTLPRLQAIIKDAEAKIVLSTQKIYLETNSWKDEKEISVSNIDEIFNIKWLPTDSLENIEVNKWSYPNINYNDIAYLQYTSGSTGNPKGVIITHENLLHNLNLIHTSFGLNNGEEYEGVIWLPIYHDMGLVGGILEPIIAGFHCTLLSPQDFLKRPLRWLQIISDKQDKQIVSGGPNFAYDLCLKASNPQKRETLNLSNWKVAFSGAEPVRAATIKEFSEAFTISGFKKNAFYPCFGLAEGTLIVSGGDSTKEPIEISVNKNELKLNNVVKTIPTNENCLTLISSGSSILDGIIRIVDPETKISCKENEVGEIWTLSKSNAKGYWGKEKLTEEIFNAFISDSTEGPFLRTGDLGFLSGGELFVTGRLKDLIIIRGNNHYPQDIETTVERCSNLLRPSSNAAFSFEKNDEEHLVIVQEARDKKDINWEEIVSKIRTAILEEHNVQPSYIVLIKSKTISKTSSGKIQRNATKEAFLNNELDYIYYWSAENDNENILIEEQKPLKTTSVNFTEENDGISSIKFKDFLINQLAKEINVTAKKVDVDKPFADFGLDSAKSLILIGRLEDEFNIKLEPTVFWTYPTIRKLSEFVNKSIPSFSQVNISEEKFNISEDNEDDFSKKVADMSEEEAQKLLMKKLGLD